MGTVLNRSGGAVHARAVDPGWVRYGFLASGLLWVASLGDGRRPREVDCGVVRVGRWRRVRFVRGAGFADESAQEPPLKRPVPHPPVLHGTRVRQVSARSALESDSQRISHARKLVV